MDIIPNKKIGFCTHSIGIKNAVIIKIRLMVPLKSILAEFNLQMQQNSD